MKTAAQRIETADTIELVPQILHLKKILVPTDFSETSKKAVQYALRFAEQFGCEIALLYVVEPATPIDRRADRRRTIHGERRVRDGRKGPGRSGG